MYSVQCLYLSTSLKPRLSVPDFVLQLWKVSCPVSAVKADSVQGRGVTNCV